MPAEILVLALIGCSRGVASEVAEKRAYQFAVTGQIGGQQKRVVSAVALDVAVGDGRVVGDERVDDVARLVGRKQPVAGVADDQPATLRGPERGGQFRRRASEVEQIHRRRERDVAVSVEPLDKLRAEIAQV